MRIAGLIQKSVSLPLSGSKPHEAPLSIETSQDLTAASGKQNLQGDVLSFRQCLLDDFPRLLSAIQTGTSVRI
jgi:hypothetical protein